MAFDADWLWERLPRLPRREQVGEYYLTDLVAIALQEGRRVVAVLTDEPAEAGGINSQEQLARANRIAWNRATQRLMARGVTILDPATTYVEPEVRIEAGTIVYPNTHLQGTTRIGSNCRIGPNSIIVDSEIGDGSRVWCSVIEGSTLQTDVEVGPFAHLRPGCHVESGVELGNYAEAKNSRIGRATKVHHFSYLGDAIVGQRVNVGAGTITCNYDGQAKHQTIIGDDAFIGSDSMLVAPVTVGARASTGAGAVVTHDVPDDATVVGVPARPFTPRNGPPREAGPPDAGPTKDGE
jgi:bifunctional UDP-N-acetylglucosamine pyrophosphorylase/glucosamine-1-phosphate N-acetyltransferase